MTNVHTGAHELVAAIRAAWAGAVPPEATNISMKTYDDEGVAAYFSGKTWEGHAPRQLRLLDFAPCIFTADAFAYYLPAYLIADIEDPETSDDNIPRVLYFLGAENDARPSSGRGRNVIRRLDGPQRAALRAYLAFLEEREQGCYDDECAPILAFLDEADT
jgi:hypothetical protein